ncbi:hypothetical protein SLEP1_g49468 [Rubroshorea leprosula]|uniref:Uncharacterized protein n=1 Tax=Rubroshorea leprosula TaxID=152421 RepID=A0AAV5LVD4_9ROSI|nr:hypothetical protein SLEP1_g48713 [Rubroshorea leprosula]GKV42006.1 hypothetical protein SLEP1_g49468 [Rubroshorea leprosula]
MRQEQGRTICLFNLPVKEDHLCCSHHIWFTTLEIDHS